MQVERVDSNAFRADWVNPLPLHSRWVRYLEACFGLFELSEPACRRFSAWSVGGRSESPASRLRQKGEEIAGMENGRWFGQMPRGLPRGSLLRQVGIRISKPTLDHLAHLVTAADGAALVMTWAKSPRSRSSAGLRGRGESTPGPSGRECAANLAQASFSTSETSITAPPIRKRAPTGRFAADRSRSVKTVSPG